MPATAATTEPSELVFKSVEARLVMAKLDDVALVAVALVKIAVDADDAPIGVLLMVPPEMGDFQTRSSEHHCQVTRDRKSCRWFLCREGDERKWRLG